MEKRKAVRQRSFLRGFVRLDSQSMGCVVRDISEAGAKLRFKFPTSFSGHVELHIPEKKIVVQTAVIWRDNCEVGVAFANPITVADPVPVDGELSDRVNRVEAEIATLKEMLGRVRKDHGGGRTAA